MRSFLRLGGEQIETHTKMCYNTLNGKCEPQKGQKRMKFKRRLFGDISVFVAFFAVVCYNGSA